jgi:ribosomal protein S6--L-glutamate ligase
MKLNFLLVKRVPDVPSPVLLHVFDILRRIGFEVESGIPEQQLFCPDMIRPAADLYVLKSHTELSLSLAGALHARGARTLNHYPNCATTQNKLIVAPLLRAAGVPVPRSWMTEDFTLLRSVAETTELIAKPYRGHRGAGITRISKPSDLDKLSAPICPMIVQEYVPGCGEDLKIYVVGDQVFAVRKPFSEMSFAVPGQPCIVDAAIRDIALRCGRALGLGLYGLDVIESPNGPVVVDVNYFPGYKGVPNVAPLIADYIRDYAVGLISPETAMAASGYLSQPIAQEEISSGVTA